jgi:hypothetical protein
MFGSLCGDNATHNAVLVTNMWEHLEDARDGERREKQLREVFWSGLIEHGSQVDRLRPGTPETAWRIIKKLVDRVFVDEEKKVVDEEKKVVDEEKKAITLLQEELVDLNRRLSETKAGKAIFTQLQRDLVKQQDEVKSLLARLEKSDNPALRKELEKERKRIEKELEDTFEDIKKLKIPIGRRLAIFFGKKSKAVSPELSCNSTLLTALLERDQDYRPACIVKLNGGRSQFCHCHCIDILFSQINCVIPPLEFLLTFSCDTPNFPMLGYLVMALKRMMLLAHLDKFALH